LDTYIISNGIKIKTDGSQEVLSVDSGEVVYAQEFRSYGKTVIVDHGGGVYSIYGQLEEIFVDSATKINTGTSVGKTGATNNWTLYFEIRIDGRPQDPIVWLK
ncbi:MAG: peptidoglycan DD-metalloendopeptidase family protein, partial [Elusimicrobiota bacterium]|nr:peptidoglycan DD-metalloendopeptidase family protein [Elusimicrobiota bacterium]